MGRSIVDADVLVPLSQEELRAKILEWSCRALNGQRSRFRASRSGGL